MRLKFYEFAGRVVGKCLYESALGSSRRLNVKARFSRSFLAQLLGLRVCYKVRMLKIKVIIIIIVLLYIYIIYNCRQYCFGLLGLISAVLMLR